ncbi:hypothetical protein Y032_0119g860 [Ancylostoma ceylanicum]|uniref:Uncharacterized protein n=1 Tax=Ancylostoma ceylanicum TaxID=53326 RepID=A0A016TBE5_9BILA|nr:hypothetical protein Y032_0119g860 [Ancylostoma ceylanicum]
MEREIRNSDLLTLTIGGSAVWVLLRQKSAILGVFIRDMQIFWISLNYVLPSFFRSSSWPLTGDFQAFGTLSNELAHNTIEACASLPQSVSFPKL